MIIQPFSCLIIQFSVVFHISFLPRGLEEEKRKKKVFPLRVRPCRMENRPSISILISGLICLECRHRTCVTFGRNAECRAVRTENT